MSIRPNEDQFMALAADSESKPGEVVMLNLLRYKPKAEDADGGSGEDAYTRYGQKAIEMVRKRGGELLWSGKVDQVLIGDTEADAWHAMALVRYPSRKAFIDMVSNKEYQQAHTHREGGLEASVLLAMTPGPGFEAGGERGI
jgi:uncharacterized protein (DUF1330 family)